MIETLGYRDPHLCSEALIFKSLSKILDKNLQGKEGDRKENGEKIIFANIIVRTNPCRANICL